MRAAKRTTISILAIGLLAASTIGAAAQEDTEGAAPVEFSGELAFGDRIAGAEVESLANRTTAIGETYGPSVSMSDPRLEGEATYVINSDRYRGGLIIEHVAIRIEGADGAWQEVPRVNVLVPGTAIPGAARENVDYHVFVGEEAYDGLTAVAQSTPTGSGLSFEGFIIEGSIPPAPEPPAE